MKVTIGIGGGLSFYVLKDRQKTLRNVLRVKKSTEPEMFIWLTQYLLDQGHDPTIEHKWYEVEL